MHCAAPYLGMRFLLLILPQSLPQMKRFLFTAASPVLHLPQFFRLPLPLSLPLLLSLLILGLQIW